MVIYKHNGHDAGLPGSHPAENQHVCQAKLKVVYND